MSDAENEQPKQDDKSLVETYLHKERTKEYPRTAFGLKVGTGMGRGDVLMLDALIANMDPGPEVIIELGTFVGFTSLFLSTSAKLRGVPFYTFEKNLGGIDRRVLDAWSYGSICYANLLGDPLAVGSLVHSLRDKRVFLLIDNGDKPHEFKTYVPMIKVSGSVAAVHDYGEEFGSQHVVFGQKQTANNFLWDLSVALFSSLRAWRIECQ